MSVENTTSAAHAACSNVTVLRRSGKKRDVSSAFLGPANFSSWSGKMRALGKRERETNGLDSTWKKSTWTELD